MSSISRRDFGWAGSDPDPPVLHDKAIEAGRLGPWNGHCGKTRAPSSPRDTVRIGFSSSISEKRIAPLASFTSASSSRADPNESRDVLRPSRNRTRSHLQIRSWQETEGYRSGKSDVGAGHGGEPRLDFRAMGGPVNQKRRNERGREHRDQRDRHDSQSNAHGDTIFTSPRLRATAGESGLSRVKMTRKYGRDNKGRP